MPAFRSSGSRRKTGASWGRPRADPPKTIAGSHLLVAAGRKPVTEGLGREAAGIKADKSGIVVDRGLRTAHRRGHAPRDCAGGEAGPYKFTHVANYHAGLVIRSAL